MKPRPMTMPLGLPLTVITCLLATVAATATEPAVGGAQPPPMLTVETSFPGGSGEVVTIDQQRRHIKLLPTKHEGRGWACWWYVRVSGLAIGEVVSLEVGRAPWATPTRAAFSSDNKSWQQTAAGQREGAWITYRQKVDAAVVWFAWGPPFVPRDAERLVREATATTSDARAFTLCRTREQREVHGIRVGRNPEARFGVWVQARQHAWESGASWVCRGFVEWLVSDDPRAQQLRDRAAISIVPIMDLDSVAIGAGGKDQQPHDHNRDWSDKPHWPAVAASMDELRRLDRARRLDLFIDLHNPGASTTRPFFYITPRKLLTERRERNLDRLLAATRAEMTGPLPFVGETRESGSAYDKRWKAISKNWVTRNTHDHVVAVTLETAWNTDHSTTRGYRTVGRQLGLAIERYLRFDPRADELHETTTGQRKR